MADIGDGPRLLQVRKAIIGEHLSEFWALAADYHRNLVYYTDFKLNYFGTFNMKVGQGLLQIKVWGVVSVVHVCKLNGYYNRPLVRKMSSAKHWCFVRISKRVTRDKMPYKKEQLPSGLSKGLARKKRKKKELTHRHLQKPFFFIEIIL